MWGVPIENQQPESVINNILDQTPKPELAHYLHASIFSPTASSIIKSIKLGFLKMWPGLTKKLIKRHLEKLSNNTMVHLHMRIQGLQSTKEKPPDIYLEDKSKTNVVFCKTVYLSTTK